MGHPQFPCSPRSFLPGRRGRPAALYPGRGRGAGAAIRDGSRSRLPGRSAAQPADRKGRRGTGKKLRRRPERQFWLELSYRYAMPVSALQEAIDARHFAELLAYERISPRGPLRDDLRALYLAQASLAPWQTGGGKLDTRLYFPHLFDEPEQTTEEMIDVARALTLAHGGEIV